MFMKTEIIKIDNCEKKLEGLERAAQTLKHGGLVVFPTETVYGLGGDATAADVAKKIYIENYQKNYFLNKFVLYYYF